MQWYKVLYLESNCKLIVDGGGFVSKETKLLKRQRYVWTFTVTISMLKHIRLRSEQYLFGTKSIGIYTSPFLSKKIYKYHALVNHNHDIKRHSMSKLR